MKVTDNFVLFWGGEFSNWYSCEFTWRDIKFNCSEQAMMWYKAFMFNDEFNMKNILNSDNPREQKAFGRMVKDFDEDEWDKVKVDIACSFLYAKFSQNEDLKAALLATGDKEIVEASPYDDIWGIALREDDKRCLDKSKWRGQNLLGKALMFVRREIEERNIS
jgi:ribA/ribD-fused uncharacterized protein